MRIFSEHDDLPLFRSPVVTVGAYDGIHLGHSHLLGIMKERAALSGGETIVVTFSQHPRNVLHSKERVRLLTSLKEKEILLEKSGVDNLFIMPFNQEVSRLPPEEFLRDFLIGTLGAKELVVGYNHHFGQNKQGDGTMLKGLEDKYGFRIHEVPRFGDIQTKVSSTTIRKAIVDGDMHLAEQLLGHPYIISAISDGSGGLIYDDPLKLFPFAGRYDVTVNGELGIFRVSVDGGTSLETLHFPGAGTELLISF